MEIGKNKQTGLYIVSGDIVTSGMDAIVNAANSHMGGGAGVDGAIHNAAGWDKLTEAAQEQVREVFGEYVSVGNSIITPAFGLEENGTKYIIHTVGPKSWEHDEAGQLEKLEDCFITTLNLGDIHGVKSIAYPLISAGVYGVPVETFAQAAKNVLPGYDFKNINRVEIVVYNNPQQEQILRDVIGIGN